MIAWTGNGSPLYDRVRGNLQTLVMGGGDYTTSLTDCRNDLTDTFSEETQVPSPGEGDYFLVRSEDSCAPGSYDSGGPGQVGSRDDGINSSPNACP